MISATTVNETFQKLIIWKVSQNTKPVSQPMDINFYLKGRILFKFKWLHNISCCSMLFHFWLSLLEHAWISHIKEQNIKLCKSCPWTQYWNISLKKNLNNVFLVCLHFWYNVTVKTLHKSSSLVDFVVFFTRGWSQT